jgi:hypothetical protein
VPALSLGCGLPGSGKAIIPLKMNGGVSFTHGNGGPYGTDGAPFATISEQIDPEITTILMAFSAKIG